MRQWLHDAAGIISGRSWATTGSGSPRLTRQVSGRNSQLTAAEELREERTPARSGVAVDCHSTRAAAPVGRDGRGDCERIRPRRSRGSLMHSSDWRPLSPTSVGSADRLQLPSDQVAQALRAERANRVIIFNGSHLSSCRQCGWQRAETARRSGSMSEAPARRPQPPSETRRPSHASERADA